MGTAKIFSYYNKRSHKGREQNNYRAYTLRIKEKNTIKLYLRFFKIEILSQNPFRTSINYKLTLKFSLPCIYLSHLSLR